VELVNDMLYKELINILPAIYKNIDFVKIINLKSLHVLERIKTVIENDSLSDFECIERIVRIFEEIGSNAGNRHDFG